MNELKELKEIINENIEWFWNNDPMLEYETDIQKLWNGFKVWCIQNCKECFENLEDSVIEKEVDNSYFDWKNH